MAILVIVGAAIIAFFAMSMTQYKSNTNETNIQTESQLTWKRLESNILITSSGIWTPNEHQIDLYNYDETGEHKKLKTSIYFDTNSDSHTIYYQEYYLDDRNTWAKYGDEQVFANLVTAFTVEIYDKDNNKIIDSSAGTKPAKVKAHIEYEANERTYVSDNTVAIRNVIVASDLLDKLYK